ncbi:mannose-6-phosphate isomerase [Pedobacter sp. UYP30]|uniref:type I phosphomannose isomerase catalytic subunit n=1 Tax=Pedobacter sp. UYP30 TaxID=1756400 RepID=UPI0033914706
MSNIPLYPLQFKPIYQYRLWGGRKLERLLSKPLPKDKPIGEAWILSDRKNHASKVKKGDLKGYTITQLMEEYPNELMGRLANRFTRFPLLLKFLDCKEVLSVQVHPSDNQKAYIPKGETGKTEAWVVLQTTKESRIYAGLKDGTNEQNLRKAIENDCIVKKLHSFVPKSGDAIFIQSGTVHTLVGTVVFEIQENSDVTFRLYDWNRIDPKAGKPRKLQVDDAIASIDFEQVGICPIEPLPDPKTPDTKEQLFNCRYFLVWRTTGDLPFKVGKTNEPRVLVCLDGKGKLNYLETSYPMNKGDVFLLPASVGECMYEPEETVTLLEIAIPRNPS